MMMKRFNDWAEKIVLWLGPPSSRFQTFKDKHGISWDAADTAVMLAGYTVASTGSGILGGISTYSGYFLQIFLLVKMLSIVFCWLYNRMINHTGI
jgi:uncharacterized membrane protein YhdT